MQCQNALLIYLIVFIIVLIVTRMVGLRYSSAIALAVLISISILAIIKPLAATGMAKSDKYSQIYVVLYLISSIYLLWYILNCACNDFECGC